MNLFVLILNHIISEFYLVCWCGMHVFHQTLDLLIVLLIIILERLLWAPVYTVKI